VGYGLCSGSYTVFGLEGDDNILVDSDSVMNHAFFGGSGDDVLTSGQGLDWLDGGSGNDIIYSVGGDDRILGGSGDDEIVLATYDDDVSGSVVGGSDGRVLILLGGGEDEVIIAALDNTQGIDIEAYVGDFARGDDQVNLEGLLDSAGGTVDLTDLIHDAHLLGSVISIDGTSGDFSAEYVDTNGNTETVDAEGFISLLGVNTSRLSASDFVYESDASWLDQFDDLIGLQAVS